MNTDSKIIIEFTLLKHNKYFTRIPQRFIHKLLMLIQVKNIVIKLTFLW